MTSTKAGTPDQQATRPSQARGWILTACVAAVAIIAVVIVVTTMNVGNISIVAGWFPVFLLWLTIAACVVAVVLRKDALREFAIGIPIGIVLAVALFLVLHFTGAIPAGAPRSMYVWLLVACLVIGLVLAGWRRANWPRRIAGVLAILLTVLSAGSAANATFQYYPTFSRLLGKNANHFLDNSQLKTLRDQVAKTGKLPDHGATLAITIPGQDLKFTPRQAYVWVPPAWFAPSHAKLPVIELLHGTPGQPSDWTRAIYADQTSLAYAKKHDGVAPILVMPDINGSLDGDTECANTPMYGQVDTYLTQTVPAFMRKEFNASTAPDSMAIAGLSEGGLCSTTLAIRNPKVYVAFGNYSGDESPTYQDEDKAQSIQQLFGGSTGLYNSYNPPYLLTHAHYPELSGWFETGAQDPVLPAAHALQGLAENAGMNTCIATPPGAHSFDFWTTSFTDSLPWLSWKLKLTPQPSSVPAQCVPGKG
jgi:S-formylglutathione hydrolase FrmB